MEVKRSRGRPPKMPEERHISKHFKLSPQAVDDLKALRERWGLKSDARTIERALREARERDGDTNGG